MIVILYSEVDASSLWQTSAHGHQLQPPSRIAEVLLILIIYVFENNFLFLTKSTSNKAKNKWVWKCTSYGRLTDLLGITSSPLPPCNLRGGEENDRYFSHRTITGDPENEL